MTLHEMIHDRFNQKCGCEGCESLIHKGEHWYCCCCCTTTQFSRFPAGSAVVAHRRGSEEQADFEFRIQVGPSSHGRFVDFSESTLRERARQDKDLNTHKLLDAYIETHKLCDPSLEEDVRRLVSNIKKDRELMRSEPYATWSDADLVAVIWELLRTPKSRNRIVRLEQGKKKLQEKAKKARDGLLAEEDSQKEAQRRRRTAKKNRAKFQKIAKQTKETVKKRKMKNDEARKKAQRIKAAQKKNEQATQDREAAQQQNEKIILEIRARARALARNTTEARTQEEKKEAETTKDDPLCPACSKNLRSVRLYPCAHLSVCTVCVASYDRCLVCCTPVEFRNWDIGNFGKWGGTAVNWRAGGREE